MIDRRATPQPLPVFVFEDLTPPIERATVADPFRAEGRRLTPRVDGADYVLVDDLADARVAALPVHWAVYGQRHRSEAMASIAEAASRGLDTIVWVNGDHEAIIEAPSVLQFQLAAARRRPGRLSRAACYPTFIDDHSPAGGIELRPDAGERPLIGFCGQADETRWANTARLGRKLGHRSRSLLGRADFRPEPLASHIRLRQRALNALDGSAFVETAFVRHDRYRAGVTDRTARRNPDDPSNIAFRANITATDYTLCVRGGGNFSTRLYETMALGRIPVIVDSGGLLPLDRELPWHELGVVVEERDVDELASHVHARHTTLGPTGVADAQRRCRQTWVDRLSLDGYFRQFGTLVDSMI